MFDPLFPVALFFGPLALAILLRIEGNRITRSILPRFSSVFLAFAAVWGLTYWVAMIAMGMFGEHMREGDFYLVMIVAISASFVIVVVPDYLAARHRKQGVPH
jgi:hypothetical protein